MAVHTRKASWNTLVHINRVVNHPDFFLKHPEFQPIFKRSGFQIFQVEVSFVIDLNLTSFSGISRIIFKDAVRLSDMLAFGRIAWGCIAYRVSLNR